MRGWRLTKRQLRARQQELELARAILDASVQISNAAAAVLMQAQAQNHKEQNR